jgi:transcriptional regulator NrdR family protein
MTGKKKSKEICKSGSCIVKRQGHTEDYDERKVYAACYSACLGTHLTKAEAERICDVVAEQVTKWIKTKKTVTSTDIFQKTIEVLKVIDEDVAFMYETHRDIS